MSIAEVIGDPFAFLDEIFQSLKKKKLDVSRFELDHICYRVSTLRAYENKKQELATLGTLLVEDFVNGRPIAIYKLHSPIHYYERKIDFIELPAPKPGRPYPEGLEHAEFVVDQALPEFTASQPEQDWDTRAPDKTINPEVALALHNGLSAKFHTQSLEKVIAIEKNEYSVRLQTTAPRALIFDLDGTLALAGPAFDQVLQRVLSYHLDREVSLSEIVSKHAPNYYSLFALFGLRDRLEIQRIIAEMGDLWHFARGDIYLFDGVETVLSMAQAENVDMYVWTARDQVSVHRTLQTLDINKYFKKVFCFNPETGGKPQPTPEQIEIFKPYGQRAALIGDSTADRDGAMNLGIPFYEAKWERDSQAPTPLDVFSSWLKTVQ